MKQISVCASAHQPERTRCGRKPTPSLRASLEPSEVPVGLGQKVERYELLLLVKRVGRNGGFSSRMIELLDYYLSFTRECDWMPGACPIVYQSLAKTALDLGVSERQVQRLERSLADLGALTWHASGNNKRYGQRCPYTGEILFAFGVDLSPLAELRPALEGRLQAKQEHDRQWMETKRQISWYRGQLRGLLSEQEEVDDRESEYAGIAVPIRTHLSLERLQELLEKHRDLHGRISRDAEHEQDLGLSLEMSPRDDESVAHNNDTNQKQSNKLDTGRASPECLQEEQEELPDPTRLSLESVEALSESEAQMSTGLEKVTLSQVLRAASPRFVEYLPIDTSSVSWSDITEAAFRLRRDLRIGQRSWGDACQKVGRLAAAVCVLLTDRALDRERGPVRIPAAYFAAMIGRAEEGRLSIDRSIHGLVAQSLS